jgi:hypothetical protein
VVVGRPYPYPLPLLPGPSVVVGSSTVVVGVTVVAVVAVVGVGELQSATGIAQEALVVVWPSGQDAVAYTVTVE